MYSSYLSEVIETRDRAHTVVAIKDLIAKHKIRFTHIAVSGLSGMLAATELASLMGKQVMIVRKRITKHSDFRVEFCGEVKGYIIVDDLISTGATVRRMKKYIDNEKEKVQTTVMGNAELKAVICYNETWDSNPRTICNVPVFKV
jgi:orotate phosphoribosyltransferase